MNKESLLLFIRRILENGSEGKSETALRQLKSILEMQNADPKLVQLVYQAIRSVPEGKEEVAKDDFSEESIRIAFERAEERRRREQLMASYGRC